MQEQRATDEDLVVREFAVEIVALAHQSGFEPYDKSVLGLAHAYLAVVAERDEAQALIDGAQGYRKGMEAMVSGLHAQLAAMTAERDELQSQLLSAIAERDDWERTSTESLADAQERLTASEAARGRMEKAIRGAISTADVSYAEAIFDLRSALAEPGKAGEP